MKTIGAKRLSAWKLRPDRNHRRDEQEMPASHCLVPALTPSCPLGLVTTQISSATRWQ